MGELTEIEKNYIIGTRHWINSQELLIATLKESERNMKRMIELNQKTLKNTQEQLTHEKLFTKNVIKIYADWQTTNDIPIDVKV